MEAAIDEPQMFADGYTHYSSEKGFHTLHNDSEFDNYLGYVSSIDATESKTNQEIGIICIQNGMSSERELIRW